MLRFSKIARLRAQLRTDKVIGCSLFAIALAGCSADTGSDAAASDSSSDAEPAAAMEQALRDPDYVATPGGLMHKSCVYGLREGESVGEEAGVIRRRDGSSFRLPRCEYPGFLKHRAGGTQSAESVPSAQTTVPESNGWLAAGWWDSSQWLRRLYVNMYVPERPSTDRNQQLFFFPSFEDSAGSTIVQPVLEYGNNGTGTGYFWTIASWYVWPGTGHSVHSDHVRVNPYDRIWCGMEANDCRSDGSHCHWAIIAKDTNTGGIARIDVTSYVSFHAAQSGVMEVYRLSGCNQLPASGSISFSGHQLFNSSFTQLKTNFAASYWSRPCSLSASVLPAGSTTLSWSP